jgi:chromosome segregation ATPase
MNPKITYAGANEVEYLVQSVTDLQRRHAELDVVLGRIHRDIEHRDRDLINLEKKYDNMKEEYFKLSQETEYFHLSSLEIKAEMVSINAGCSHLLQSIQSVNDNFHSLQEQQEFDRQRVLKSIAQAKEAFVKIDSLPMRIK